jgi:hypothetical protein
MTVLCLPLFWRSTLTLWQKGSIMKRWQPLRLAALTVLVGASILSSLHAGDDPVEARMRRDTTLLASDECEGRGVGTRGINLAADAIAEEFRKAGLKSAGTNGSFFQPFTIPGPSQLDGPNSLVLRGPNEKRLELAAGTDFQVMGLAHGGKVSAPLVFVGYGATARKTAYDDYKDVDVTGKIVLMLRKTPRAEDPHAMFDGPMTPMHAALDTKMANADLHKAAAVLFVNDHDTARDRDDLMPFEYTAYSPSSLPAVHLRRNIADVLVQAGRGNGLGAIEQEIDRDLKPRSGPLTGWTADLDLHVRRTVLPAKNVIGVAEGEGPLAEQTVVIGAHYDHLGYGRLGSLALQNQQGKAIHHGADDNGSGTTVLMELARRFGPEAHREGRRLVFIAFSGEERGLLGSEYYCKNPVFPLGETVAMINMDMVGRLRPDREEKGKDKLIVYGTGTAASFDKLIDVVNVHAGFRLHKVKSGMGPSDQQSFYVKGIPVFFFFTDYHNDYHRPSDTADKINFAGMERIAALVFDLASRLATSPERPQFVKVKEEEANAVPHALGPRLGIVPDYGDDREGVRVSGVREGTPAAKAGMQEGDRILEIGGKPIRNLQVYMAVMSSYKKGDKLDVGIERNSKKLVLHPTLE